jgi:glycosyltransferase involved in cell wall biosynthesis
MIVGIDARAAAEVPAGRGRLVRELLAALAAREDDHRYLLYCRAPWDEVALDARFRWVEIGLPDPAWHAAAALRGSRGCDVFLSTNSYLTAWMLRVPSVVVVYDMVAFMAGTRAQRRAARIERATIGPALRRADRLACISRSTESDLLRLFPRAAGKTAVIPLAADARFYEAQPSEQVAARHGVAPGAYVLAAGTLEPRKNLLRLIRAHAALAAPLRAAHPLLIVGPRGWEEQEILRAAGSEGVRLAGFVPDDELAALYAGCSVFCYPSLYEGFGLPVLEAMASGTPVVATSSSSIPEVAGDAAILVEPDPKALAAGVDRARSERPRLRAAGLERARQFSWAETARLTAEVYRELV